jgi:hypothetical protein
MGDNEKDFEETVAANPDRPLAKTLLYAIHKTGRSAVNTKGPDYVQN